ncbi:mitochondrial FAD carrier protein [Agrocybe pediades]|nr:mitochondrial FAD carrier protein [Agrocybe pediades]
MGITTQPPSFFPTTALDHAAAGLGAGVVTTLCMNPLDLLKVKLQVTTQNPSVSMGKHIWLSLKDIQQTQGWRGLYRGLVPNIAGNASSWGLYFLFYNMLKKRASGGDITKPLSASEYLLCSAQASAVTAVMTNPLWLVRVRMFTSRADSPNAYRGLWDGLSKIVRTDGVLGLFRGTSLGLFGVSNGAIQFMVYEKMKAWGFDRKRRKYEKSGKKYDQEVDKLSNLAYTTMSITSKLAALSVTYPYQVVRSRIQNDAQSALFPTIPATIKRTWAMEGFRGFFRGLGTNLVRVLPGTCITFVVYENLAWLLRTTARKRADKLEADD